MLAPASPSWRPRFINKKVKWRTLKPFDFIPWGWYWGEFGSEAFSSAMTELLFQNITGAFFGHRYLKKMQKIRFEASSRFSRAFNPRSTRKLVPRNTSIKRMNQKSGC